MVRVGGTSDEGAFQTQMVNGAISAIVNTSQDTPGPLGNGTISLRDAINQAQANNDQPMVIYIDLQANATITLSNASATTTYGTTAFVIGDAQITIDGANTTGLIISGDGLLRPFTVTSTADVTLKNLTIEDGLAEGTGIAAEGGAVYASGSIALTSVSIRSNHAQGKNASTFGTDGADAAGGGLYLAGGDVTLNDDTLSGNAATGGLGGAGYIGSRGRWRRRRQWHGRRTLPEQRQPAPEQCRCQRQ